jgi:hypothetical protein
LCGLLLLGVLSLSAFPLIAEEAKPVDQEGGKPKRDSGLSLDSSVAFKDVDSTDSTFDWGPDSGGPEFTLEAWSRSRYAVGGLPWLRLGPDFEATSKLDTDTVTEGNDPYLVADSFSLRALAGLGAAAGLSLGPGKLGLGLSLLGGIGVLDLSEADSDYLETGADPTDFWFRVEPCVGLDASVSYKIKAFEARMRDRYIIAWDSGSAYGRTWTPGFEEAADARLSYELIDGKKFGLCLRALGDFSLNSKLVEPELKYGAAFRVDLSWDKLGELKVKPVAWSYDADVPGLSLSAAEYVERQLSGEVEWEAPGRFGDW